MGRFEKFLFYYSILAVTTIFFTSAVFTPTPQNFIASILLFPLIAYFWLKLTSARGVSFGKWSLRLVLAITLLSALGIYSFSLSGGFKKDKESLSPEEQALTKLEELKGQIETLQESEISEAQLAEELAKIRDELERLNLKNQTLGYNQGLADILEDIDSKYPAGYLTVKEPLGPKLDVFQEPSFSSKTIGQIDYGQDYPYFEKQGAWYRIELPDEKEAWVNEAGVKEVSQN